jgi:hypothetical protein
MYRRSAFTLALAAGLALAACTEQPQEQGMQEPSSAATAQVVSSNCNLTVVNSAIEDYFSGNQRVAVRGYRDAMVGASNLTLARVQGFNILREIGIRSRSVPQLASTGSALAVEVLDCVFQSLASTDTIEQVPTSTFFVEELSNGGGFGVRNGSGDPAGPVQGVQDGIVIAGIAPPAPVNATSWNASLGTQRVLFYGSPGSTAGTYHWAVVPRASTFDPELVVTTCVNDELNGGDPNLMLTESSVGVLAFSDATYIGCGLAPVATATPASEFDLLGRLADLGRKLVLPEPALATVLLPGTVGGRAGSVKSLFGPKSIETALLSVFVQPPPKVKVGVQFTISFRSKTPPPGPFTVNGTLTTVVAVNNNGVPTALFLDPDGSGPEQPFKCGEPGLQSCTVPTTSVGDVHGLAEFFLSVTKPGAAKFVATGLVDGRDTEVFGAITNKTNVGP